MNLEALFFYPLAVLTLVGAAGVILFRNPLHCALSLVCSFFFLAATYILLAGHFVGILQIIVYTGAIMVLFLFVIMLLALEDTQFGHRRTTFFKVVGALCAGGVLVGAIYTVVDGGALLTGSLVQQPLPADFGTVAAVGRQLFGALLLPFEAVSALLLVAILGAVVVAKGRL